MVRALTAGLLLLVTIPAVAPAGTRSLEKAPDWTVEGNQVRAYLGSSVATAGDVNGDGYSDVLVAASHYDNGQSYEGKVWLYLGSPTGLSATPAWTAEGDQQEAWFGACVSTAGDVNNDGYDDVVIGAPGYDGDYTNAGAAFLYLGSADGLSPTPSWTAEADQAYAWFGGCVSTAGDVNGDGRDDVIIGAESYTNVEWDEGKVFLYRGSANGLFPNPVWTAEGNLTNAGFGASVSGAGDVNADGYDDVIIGTGINGPGKAVVFLGNSYSLGSMPAWEGNGDGNAGRFGMCVSGAGDVDGDGYADVAVAAPEYANGENNEGKVYVYGGSPGGLSPTPAWTMEGDQTGADFGVSVARAGDVNGDGYGDLVIGADGYTNGEYSEGGAFLYLGGVHGLESSPLWIHESDQMDAAFGASVACAGDVDGDGLSDVLVGAPYFDHGEDQEGRAYLYRGGTTDVGEAAWIRPGGQPEARSGASVAFAGDVDADGFGDLVIGAPLYDRSYPGEGLAELYRGGPPGVSNDPSWSGAGGQQGAAFGSSLAGAGDVNGDGYDDVIVGAPGSTGSAEAEGKACLYTGSSAGLSPDPAWTRYGGQIQAGFGRCVSSAGDVNGDGYADVVVGADRADHGQVDEGRAFVFLGSATGLSQEPAWTGDGGQAGAGYGQSVASAGDVNGDGYGDVIIGARSYDAGELDEGRVYLYLGSPAGLLGNPSWGAEGNQVSAFLGDKVAGAGDVNGDGYSDIVIAAPGYDLDLIDEGMVAVYLGGPNGPAATPAWVKYGTQAGARLGSALSASGDVDGDGLGDLLVGASGFDDTYADGGRVYLYLGTPAGPSGHPDWLDQGDRAGAAYGCAVSGSGDVNGDGFADLLIGASGGGQDAEGAAFLHYGNAHDGLDRAPAQWRADDLGRIGLLGRTETPSFRLHALGRTPAGRGKVRLVCEVKPYGTPFDGSGLLYGPQTDTGAPVENRGSLAPLDLLAEGLDPGTPYCWRIRFETDSPFVPRSLWLSPPGNASTELDLRIAGGSSSAESGIPPGSRLRVTPNPAAGPSEVLLQLPKPGAVRITIVDAQGRRIATLADGTLAAGRHSFTWNARDSRGERLATGVYFVRCQTSDGTRTAKVIRIGGDGR